VKLFHIVLWSNGRVAESINVRAANRADALKEARFQYPNWTPEITMEKEVEPEPTVKE